MNLKQINKKLFIIIGIIIGIVVIVVLAIFIMTKDKKLEFSTIEKKLSQGAEKYYNDNPDLLPKSDGGKVVVDVTTLEDGSYITLLSKMTEEGTICNGEVRVSNNGGSYLYIPYLNCGKEYTTTELYKKIIELSNVIKKDDGLYKMNDEYVFRGNPKNNFIKFADQLWLIMKVDKDNHIKILQHEAKNKVIWDGRYNIDRDSRDGINDYHKSNIEQELLELFKGEELISEKFKKNVVYKNYCIGSRNDNETDKTGKVDCSKLTEKQPVGLITVTEFLNASLDTNCKTTTSESCQNYNYLVSEKNPWWTITASTEKSHRVYRVSNATVSTATANKENRLRPTVYLSDNIVYSGGIGTINDPYIVK